jgi:hypothetical protein
LAVLNHIPEVTPVVSYHPLLPDPRSPFLSFFLEDKEDGDGKDKERREDEEARRVREMLEQMGVKEDGGDIGPLLDAFALHQYFLVCCLPSSSSLPPLSLLFFLLSLLPSPSLPSFLPLPFPFCFLPLLVLLNFLQKNPGDTTKPVDLYSRERESRPVRFHSGDIYARQLEEPEAIFLHPSRADPHFVPLRVEEEGRGDEESKGKERKGGRGGKSKEKEGEQGKGKEEEEVGGKEERLLSLLEEWYRTRAREIESRSGQLDNALALLDFGESRGVGSALGPGLVSLKEDLLQFRSFLGSTGRVYIFL